MFQPMKRRGVPGEPPFRRWNPGSAGVRSVAAALLALPLWQGSPPEAKQERDCTLVGVGGYTVSERFDSVNYTHRASGGIDYRCTDGTRILADSAVVWEHSGNLVLVDRVHFEDAETDLDSDSAYYFANVRELRAWSGVRLRDHRSGAVLTGDTLYYLRESRFRTMDRIIVHGRNPRAVVNPARRPAAPSAEAEPPPVPPESESPGTETDDVVADSLTGEEQVPAPDSVAGGVRPEAAGDAAGAEPSLPVDSVSPIPYEVEAPRLYIDGRQFFRAGGGVVVTRDSLVATGDSLDYDQEVGAMLIFGNAHVVDRGFELSGTSVSVTPTVGLNEEILARENARLTGDHVLMEAPAIRLFLEEGQVSRIVALPSVIPLPGTGGEEPFDTTGLTPGDVERARILAEQIRGEAEEEAEIVPDSLPRPFVVAADFNLAGDSIEVLSPNQLLDVVTAVGAARADAMNPDAPAVEELPQVAASDWIEGRTIVARFTSEEPAGDSAAASRDTTAGRVRLESVTATSDARSLYRLFATDAEEEEPDTAGEESDTVGQEPGTAGAESDTVGQESDTAGTEPGPAKTEVVVAGADTGAAEPEPLAAAGDSAGPDLAIAVSETGSAPAAPDADAGEAGVPPPEADTLQDEEDRPPALHYVRGNQITIHLEGRKVVRMEVQGQTVGYHFEPLPPDSLPVEGDTLVAAIDTVNAGVDTTGSAGDTANAGVDTTGSAGDTAGAAPDTAATTAGAARTPPDTTRVPSSARSEPARRPESSGLRRVPPPPFGRGSPGARR